MRTSHSGARPIVTEPCGGKASVDNTLSPTTSKNKCSLVECMSRVVTVSAGFDNCRHLTRSSGSRYTPPVKTVSPSTTGEQVAVDLPPGAIVGEYRIEKKLKQGGMGTVYEAVHQMINKRAAVKVLKPELCENDEALHRFVQEARAVNQINHPNIVDVFGFGTTDDGRSFLAMELLVGETLGERMARPPVPRRDTCSILREITHALEAAHACGVVHRDLKPENVFLASFRGQAVVKLLDFGIAKLTGGGGLPGPVEVTQPGTLIGTPKYMAPEQARGLAIDGSADIYALGVIAFELLAGRPPFTAHDAVELIAKHITLKPPAPSDFAPRLPTVADELVGAMLDKVPGNRPSLGEIRAALDAIANAADARPDAVVARRPATTIVSTLKPPARAASPTLGDDRRPRRRRWWLGVPVGLAIVAASIRITVGIADRANNEQLPAQEPIITPLPVPLPATTATATADPAIEIDVKPASAPPSAPPPAPSAPHPVHRPRQIPHHVTAAKPAEPETPAPTPAPPPAPIAKPASGNDDGLRDPFQSN
jgi:serine/threonine protein kinase